MVSHDVPGIEPWTFQPIRFGVPHLANKGCLAAQLQAQHDPAVAVWIPMHTAGVHVYRLVTFGIVQHEPRFVGLQQSAPD